MESFLNLFHPYDADVNHNKHLPIDLPPEPQLGNVEYKLKIINPSQQRFEHLVTQMKWRLREGQGEAIYEIGVTDNGVLAGVSDSDMIKSLNTLKQMAIQLGATTTVLKQQTLDNGMSISKVSIKNDNKNDLIEIRVAVLGNANAGKSSLLGVLTQGSLDNGRGKARLNMFRHLHEVQTGRTSSISHKILGFSSQGQPINYGYGELVTAEEICNVSTKLVTFMDLAGHRKYIHTTIKGLSGYLPHHAMLVISGTVGAIGMTKEHLCLTIAMDIPFFIVITKIDQVSPMATIDSLQSLINQARSQVKVSLLIIESENDVITACSKHNNVNIVPIFCVSSVNGAGLNLLLKFLYVLPPNMLPKEKKLLEQDSPEFQIDENFYAGDVKILGGLLIKGLISEGMEMQIGPLKDGSFIPVTIKSIHRNRVPCTVVRAGQSAAISLNTNIDCLRNGMVLIQTGIEKSGCIYFQANIISYHGTSFYPGFQSIVHIGHIQQAATIVEVFPKESTIQRNASVMFKFKKHPEYLSNGKKILFIDGQETGIGEVVKIFPLN